MFRCLPRRRAKNRRYTLSTAPIVSSTQEQVISRTKREAEGLHGNSTVVTRSDHCLVVNCHRLTVPPAPTISSDGGVCRGRPSGQRYHFITSAFYKFSLIDWWW